MAEWIRLILDIVLIGIVGVGIYHALRLIKHLNGLQQGRLEMERFVREFSATVLRAEIGIKGLKQTARESGDDLEKLVEKAVKVRDELHFLVESADQIAERLSQSAALAMRPATQAESKTEPQTQPPTPKPSRATAPQDKPVPQHEPSSRAEKELLEALQKLS